MAEWVKLVVGPSQIIDACAKDAAATNQASAALFRKTVEVDLNILIINARFRIGFGSRFFSLVETIENIGDIKGLATASLDKSWCRLDSRH